MTETRTFLLLKYGTMRNLYKLWLWAEKDFLTLDEKMAVADYYNFTLDHLESIRIGKRRTFIRKNFKG